MSTYPIADTHTHLYFPAFNTWRDKSIQNAEKGGVKLQIQIGCDEISSFAALELAKSREDYYSTLGLHPCDVHLLGKPVQYRIFGYDDYELQAKDLDQLMNLFEKVFQVNQEKIVGFGETGFDYHHQDTPEIRELQRVSFLRHIELARKFEKALVVHTRSAKRETLDFLRENKDRLFYGDCTGKSAHLSSVAPAKEEPPSKKRASNKNMRGVIHCFSEDREFAREVTQEYGFFIGIGGVATYKSAEKVREAIKATPLEYIVTETDAPFLVPQAYKNKTKVCESAFLDSVVELIAELKGQRVEEVGEVLFENAKRLFRINNL